MKICVDCNCDQADELEHCAHCGGELRHRSISEALIDLKKSGEVEAEVVRLPCPRCGAEVTLIEHRCVCSNCRAKISKAADAEGRPVLIKS
jgi:ribosomal protein S27AE